ncbi:hypothetical protein ACFL0T_04575 [Candidatus Omnitrophota bacterium]
MSNRIYIYIVVIVSVVFMCHLSFGADAPGTSNTRPNMAGGYDYFDSEGNKTGSSMPKTFGGYDYYDPYGNLTGALKYNKKDHQYEYFDAENIKRGNLKSDPYGGYRYSEQKEGLITSDQMNIRRNYKYSDPYGGGVETFSTDVLQGKDSQTINATGTGLSTKADSSLSSTSSSLSTTDSSLSTSN